MTETLEAMEQEIKNLKDTIEIQEKTIKVLRADRDFWLDAYKRTQGQLNDTFGLVRKYQAEKEKELLE